MHLLTRHSLAFLSLSQPPHTHTHTGMGLLGDDPEGTAPALDNTGHRMKVQQGGPADDPTAGMTKQQKVQWVKEEEKKRELTEHERKLLEEEFAEERRNAARSTFRDRFKKITPEP